MTAPLRCYGRALTTLTCAWGIILLAVVASAQGGGEPAWDGAIGQPGLDERVLSFAVFDDGSGPALYAGGPFTSAGGVAATGIARWDGDTWHPVGGGVDGTVSALGVFDDGSGRALYAGGWFSTAGGTSASHVARWDGSSWSPVGSGIEGSVQALAVFDDGTGPALYAGGGFSTASGQTARRVARLDGSTWTALGGGVNGSGSVHDFAVFDDGTGPALYAAGDFSSIGGVATRGIARWSGSGWSSVGGGVDGVYPNVYALAVFDGGDGEALYAAGSFSSAGGVPALRIARWSGQGWEALPAGGLGEVGCCLATTLAVLDDGTGPALFAGGYFHVAGGHQVNRVARFDGQSWSDLGGGVDDVVHALSASPDEDAQEIFIGGNFTTAGELEAHHVARWGSGLPVSTDPGAPPASLPVLTLYPNPVSAAASITFDVPSAASVQLAVYDLLGRRVGLLVNGHTAAGRHVVEWEARGLSPGLYVVRLATADGATSRRVLIIR